MTIATQKLDIIYSATLMMATTTRTKYLITTILYKHLMLYFLKYW